MKRYGHRNGGDRDVSHTEVFSAVRTDQREHHRPENGGERQGHRIRGLQQVAMSTSEFGRRRVRLDVLVVPLPRKRLWHVMSRIRRCRLDRHLIPQ
jgi:hypothetical protein